jgi:hypothetical protein
MIQRRTDQPAVCKILLTVAFGWHGWDRFFHRQPPIEHVLIAAKSRRRAIVGTERRELPLNLTQQATCDNPARDIFRACGRAAQLGLQHSDFEHRNIRIQGCGLECDGDRVPGFHGINDAVNPKSRSAIPRVGLFVIGLFD